MKDVCQWCLTVVKVPVGFNPKTHTAYCNNHCAQKDWLFKRWQNDEYLTTHAANYKGG